MSGDLIPDVFCNIDDAWIYAISRSNSAVKTYERRLRKSQLMVAKVTDLLEERFKTIVSLNHNVNNTKNTKNTENEGPGHKCCLPKIPSAEADTRFCGFVRKSSENLFSVIINNIISVRVEVTNLRSKSENPTSDSWDSLVNKVEEIETQALTLMTSPSPIFDDCRGTMDYQMELVMKRLESQAEECLQACKTLVSTGLSRLKHPSPLPAINVTSGLSVSGNELMFPTFHEARSLLENYTNILYPSLWDSRFKKDALKIKQDITCACGQISSHDPVHCIGRLECLLKVLNYTATNSDSKEMGLGSLKNNQLINNFAWQCLYSSTISQAERQFAYNIDITLVYASLLSGIFALFPDKLYGFFGRIFLACPALGLFCDPSGLHLMDEMFSDMDVMNNWRGIVRLFAALALAHPPPHLNVKRHKLLNPSLLWRVISGIINQEFIPCATAEVLQGILEIGGTVFMNLYGNQASRLINTIRMIINKSPILRQSLPEIQLLSLLEKYENIDEIHEKIGFIDESFWKPS